MDYYFDDSKLFEYMLSFQEEYDLELIDKILDSNYEDVAIDYIIETLKMLKRFSSRKELINRLYQSGLNENSILLRKILELYDRNSNDKKYNRDFSFMLRTLENMRELSTDDIEELRKRSLRKIDKLGNDYYSIYAYVKHNIGYSLDKLEVLIYRMKRCPKFYLQYKNLVNNVEQLLNIPDKDNFIFKVNEIGLNNITKLLSDYLEYCEKSYMETKNISEYPIISTIDGINVRLASDDFGLLISVVRNKNALSESKEIVSNYLEKYDDNAKPSKQSVHSLSFINSKNMGTFGKKYEREYIFGYQGYQNGFLVGSSIWDNFSFFDVDDHIMTQHYDLEIDADNLSASSTSVYNEITAYRTNEITYEVLSPKCIVCYDEINDKTVLAAKKFKNDIVLVPKKKFMHRAYNQICNSLKSARTLNEKIKCIKLYERFLNTYVEYFNKNEYKFDIYCKEYKELYDEIELLIRKELERISFQKPQSFAERIIQILEVYNLYTKKKYVNYSIIESGKVSTGSPIPDAIIDINDISCLDLYLYLNDLIVDLDMYTSNLTIADFLCLYRIYPNIKLTTLKIRFSNLFKAAYLFMKDLPDNVITALKNDLPVYRKGSQFVIGSTTDLDGFTKIEIPQLSAISKIDGIGVINADFIRKTNVDERYEVSCVKFGSSNKK